MKVYEAPQSTANLHYKSLFLAGSIEMGKAEGWQNNVISQLKIRKVELEREGLYISDFDIVNPRRSDWDSSWEQKYENPQFNQQVTWELHNLKKCRDILFYFDPSTQSPITLLELGLVVGINSKKVSVICPEGYWRKGNIDVLCHVHGVKQFSDIKSFVEDYLKC